MNFLTSVLHLMHFVSSAFKAVDLSCYKFVQTASVLFTLASLKTFRPLILYFACVGDFSYLRGPFKAIYHYNFIDLQLFGHFKSSFLITLGTSQNNFFTKPFIFNSLQLLTQDLYNHVITVFKF